MFKQNYPTAAPSEGAVFLILKGLHTQTYLTQLLDLAGTSQQRITLPKCCKSRELSTVLDIPTPWSTVTLREADTCLAQQYIPQISSLPCLQRSAFDPYFESQIRSIHFPIRSILILFARQGLRLQSF